MKFISGIVATILGLGFILFPTLSMVGGKEVYGEFLLKLGGGFLLFMAGIFVLWLEVALAKIPRQGHHSL